MWGLRWIGGIAGRSLRVPALILFAAVVCLTVGPSAVVAQSMPGGLAGALGQLPPEEQQQILQQIQSQGGVAGQPQVIVPSVVSQRIVLPPTPSAASSFPQSNLEKIMSQRAGVELRQFGYDQLGVGQTVTAAQVGAIQDDYILGPGDQLDVTLRGQDNSEYNVTVDRDGRVILPKLAPIVAAGRRFGEFRAEFVAAIRRGYVATQGYVSITNIRQINVLVVGEVTNPGLQTLNGLSNLLDALNLAGGVKKSGTLRNIIVVRAGSSIHVDLYSILRTHEGSPNLSIAQGDRIIVPTIGSTVAVTGAVRRGRIYELPPGSGAIGERELLYLADGPQLPGVYREMILKIRPDGKEELVDASNNPSALIRDGEILFMERAVNRSLGRVSLEGPVRLPGEYPLERARTLHDLLPSADAFAPTPYMLMGVVVRTDPKTLQRVLIPFSPLRVIQGRENMDLISDDTVHILTVSEMQQLVGRALAQLPGADQTNNQPQTPGTLPSPGAVAPSAVPGSSVPGAPSAAPSTGVAAAPAGDASGDTSMLGALSDSDSAFFGRVLADYRATITGAVHKPDVYLVAPGTTLAELLTAADGLNVDADASGFEITSTLIDNSTGTSKTDRKTVHLPPSQYDRVVLQPLDAIDFHHVFTDRANGKIAIDGQVRYPGAYSFLRGERLSQVLIRAGGLTDIAYPYGTVFLRRSLAEVERAGNEKIAQQLDQQLMSGLTTSGGSASKTPVDPATFLGMQTFINQIKDQRVLGRLTIIADPSVLAANPQRDPILETGDTIYIPQRPSTVTVLGDVMQPGNFEFSPDASLDDYITQAGGYGQNALTGYTFIVYPDGTARQADASWVHFNSAAIPPGSVIFVPRDLFPIDWIGLTATIGSVIQSFAVTAASLAVLSKQ